MNSTALQTNNINNIHPLLNPEPPAGEEQRVQAVFDMAKEMLGIVPAGLRLYGISPPLLESFAGNVGYFHGGTELPDQLTTMIRYLVSDEAECNFCIGMNEGALVNMGKDIDDIRAARSDYHQAPLEAAEKVLLGIALRSVNDPASISADDLDTARSAGWSDREIFDAVVQAAGNRAFNFVLKTFNVESQDAFA